MCCNKAKERKDEQEQNVFKVAHSFSGVWMDVIHEAVGTQEKKLPNWIVCLAFGQSAHCSGKTLARSGRDRGTESSWWVWIGWGRRKKGRRKRRGWWSGVTEFIHTNKSSRWGKLKPQHSFFNIAILHGDSFTGCELFTVLCSRSHLCSSPSHPYKGFYGVHTLSKQSWLENPWLFKFTIKRSFVKMYSMTDHFLL